MPRTAITPVALKGGPAQANLNIYTSALGTGVAADTANGNQAAFSGSGLVLVARAPNGARTVTVTSAADTQLARTKDITADVLEAGATRYYGPFPNNAQYGWVQSDQNLYFTCSQGDVLFSVLALP